MVIEFPWKIIRSAHFWIWPVVQLLEHAQADSKTVSVTLLLVTFVRPFVNVLTPIAKAVIFSRPKSEKVAAKFAV